MVKVPQEVFHKNPLIEKREARPAKQHVQEVFQSLVSSLKEIGRGRKKEIPARSEQTVQEVLATMPPALGDVVAQAWAARPQLASPRTLRAFAGAAALLLGSSEMVRGETPEGSEIVDAKDQPTIVPNSEEVQLRVTELKDEKDGTHWYRFDCNSTQTARGRKYPYFSPEKLNELRTLYVDCGAQWLLLVNCPKSFKPTYYAKVPGDDAKKITDVHGKENFQPKSRLVFWCDPITDGYL